MFIHDIKIPLVSTEVSEQIAHTNQTFLGWALILQVIMPYTWSHETKIITTIFAKMCTVHTQFQCSLFTTTRRIPNSSYVYYSQKFNGLLLLRLLSSACLTSTSARMVYNGPILPGQADSQQGITTQQVGKTRHGCSYIL